MMPENDAEIGFKSEKQCRNERVSLRGRLLRELVAAGVKATGSDILAFANKCEKLVRTKWRTPRGWKLEMVSLPHARAWYLVPKNCTGQDAAVLHLHGGGYTLGFMPPFKHFAIKLAKLAGSVPVLALDYRVAPQHPFPAALEDACDAVEWLTKEKGVYPHSVVVAGESCGAGLALALAMRLRDTSNSSLRALVLMSPWSDLTCSSGSYVDRYHMDPMFGRKKPMPNDSERTAVGKIYAGDHDMTDPYMSPAYGDFSGLPPMLIHVGEYEMLFDDSEIIYHKAKKAGMSAELKVWRGMFHVFQLADWLIPESRAAWREIGIFLRRHIG